MSKIMSAEEAIGCILEAYSNDKFVSGTPIDPSPYVARILALMPVSVVKPGPDVSGLVEALERIAIEASPSPFSDIARYALSTFKGGEDE